MPRAALIAIDEKAIGVISWDGKKGAIFLHAGPNRFAIECTGDMQKDAETLSSLCRYLQALSVELPPAQPPFVPSRELPQVTEEDLARAQVFTDTAAAKGIKQPKRSATHEQILDILDDL